MSIGLVYWTTRTYLNPVYATLTSCSSNLNLMSPNKGFIVSTAIVQWVHTIEVEYSEGGSKHCCLLGAGCSHVVVEYQEGRVDVDTIWARAHACGLRTILWLELWIALLCLAEMHLKCVCDEQILRTLQDFSDLGGISLKWDVDSNDISQKYHLEFHAVKGVIL